MEAMRDTFARSSIPDPSPAWSADRVVFGKVVWGIMLKHHEDQ
ncbi:hypothetical protein [Bradyrhizobium sp. sGM-13]|nr:hypothetical protein [Bradyrhizobium sp. sGM-13]